MPEAHAFHDELPGYSPQQVLVDGCAVCEARSKDPRRAIAHMDRERFARAWRRALQSEREGLTDISDAEALLFDVLGPIALKVEMELL